MYSSDIREGRVSSDLIDMTSAAIGPIGRYMCEKLPVPVFLANAVVLNVRLYVLPSAAGKDSKHPMSTSHSFSSLRETASSMVSST